MRSSIVTVLFGSLLVTGAATPRYQDMTINFDDVKPRNSKDYALLQIPKVYPLPQIPKGYKGLDFEPRNRLDMHPVATEKALEGGPFHDFAKASEPYVWRGGEGEPTLSIRSHVSSNTFTLKSFDLACYNYSSDATLVPQKCSIMVSKYTEYDGLESSMYNYEVDSSQQPTFVTFDGPSGTANRYDFSLVGQPAGKYPITQNFVFNLDNIVTRQRV